MISVSFAFSHRGCHAEKKIRLMSLVLVSTWQPPCKQSSEPLSWAPEEAEEDVEVEYDTSMISRDPLSSSEASDQEDSPESPPDPPSSAPSCFGGISSSSSPSPHLLAGCCRVIDDSGLHQVEEEPVFSLPLFPTLQDSFGFLQKDLRNPLKEGPSDSAPLPQGAFPQGEPLHREDKTGLPPLGNSSFIETARPDLGLPNLLPPGKTGSPTSPSLLLRLNSSFRRRACTLPLPPCLWTCRVPSFWLSWLQRKS